MALLLIHTEYTTRVSGVVSSQNSTTCPGVELNPHHTTSHTNCVTNSVVLSGGLVAALLGVLASFSCRIYFCQRSWPRLFTLFKTHGVTQI